ncbi:hypothetical protein VTO73DRAFT_15574 [Trametes versicolor]
MPIYTLYGAGKSNAPHSSACDLLYPPARSSCSEHEPAASVLRARRSLQHPSRPSALASYYVDWRARKPYQTVGSSLPAVPPPIRPQNLIVPHADLDVYLCNVGRRRMEVE